MAEPWIDRWVKHRGGGGSGGQGQGFLAVARDGSGQRAFVKVLTRQREIKARGRFRREVAAYETLAGAGIPKLLDHNAKHWEDKSVPLYLALEYIEGGTLGAWLAKNGTSSFGDALVCVDAIAAVLTRCHEIGVVHRDIKPDNIMVGPDGLADAVLVDFGLSFNQDEDDDLTRAGDQFGNRFLRLPEYAFGGRNAVGDVTQLAGIFLFLLTGQAPRLLLDERSQMPHQRPAIRAALEAVLDGRQLVRLLGVFDRAFASAEAERFPTAAALVEAMRPVEDPLSADEYEDLLAQVAEIASSPEQQRRGQLRDALREFVHDVTQRVQEFGRSRHLQITTTAFGVDETNNPPRAHHSISITQHGQSTNYVVYAIEVRGAEYVVTADGAEVWRGRSADDALTKGLTEAAARAFLAGSAGD